MHKGRTIDRRCLFPILAVLLLLLAPSLEAQCTTCPPYPGKQPTKDAGSATVQPGGTITWTITIENDKFADDAEIEIRDDVPDPIDFPGIVLPFNVATDVDPLPVTPTYDGRSEEVV